MEPLEIIQFTVTQNPRDISELVPDVSQDLKTLVAMMIAKNKRDRVQVCLDRFLSSLRQNMSALVKALKEIQQNLQIDNKVIVSPEAVKYSGWFYLTEKLYGREEEIMTLMDELNMIKLKRKKRSINFIAGLSGVGKTDLVNEVWSGVVNSLLITSSSNTKSPSFTLNL